MVYAPSSVSYSCQPRNVAPRSVVGVVLRQACPLGQVELLSRISPSAPLTYPKCINNNLTHRTECIYAFSRNNAPSRAAGYTPLRWSKKTTCGDVKANTQHAIDLMHHRRPDSGASAKLSASTSRPLELPGDRRARTTPLEGPAVHRAKGPGMLPFTLPASPFP